MSAPASRRGFLRGLAGLPLIGGSVALIGAPSAVASPVTPGMLATYLAWLHFEKRAIETSVGMGRSAMVPCINPGSSFHFTGAFDAWRYGYEAQQRAPVILSATGCPLTSPEAEEQWASTFQPCWKERAR